MMMNSFAVRSAPLPSRTFVWIPILAFTFAFVLACGRAPEPVPSRVPTRIVSQVVDSDEILWALGPDVRARVVGISSMADDPRYSTVTELWPATIARVPGTSEALLAARPDLVIVAEFSAAETRGLLTHAAIPTLVLAGFEGFADYRRRVHKVAIAVSAEDRGRELVAAFDRKLETLTHPRREGDTVVSWSAGMVAGRSTTFDDVAGAIGLVNVATAQGIVGHRAIAIEQLVAWDPRFIVTSCEDDCSAAERDLAALPGVSATRAAREGRILAVPSRILYNAGPGMLDAAEHLLGRMEPP